MERKRCVGCDDRMLVEALGVALFHHRGQPRKGKEIPYISHPMAVASLVLDAGGDTEMAVAALLHDTVEDGGGERAAIREEIRARFGDRVLALMRGLTKPEEWEGRAEAKEGKAASLAEWQARKAPYLGQVEKASREVRLIALADKLHNARAILADYRDKSEELWKRFNGGRDGTLWYYGALVRIFREEPPDRLLFEEFERTVAETARLAAEAHGPAGIGHGDAGGSGWNA